MPREGAACHPESRGGGSVSGRAGQSPWAVPATGAVAKEKRGKGAEIPTTPGPFLLFQLQPQSCTCFGTVPA